MTTTVDNTDAEIAIRQALHELEVQRGSGIFNIPALIRILESGVRVEPVRVINRSAMIGTGLLSLDDLGGR